MLPPMGPGRFTLMQPFLDTSYAPGLTAAQVATPASTSTIAATTATIRRLSRPVACSAAGMLANGMPGSIGGGAFRAARAAARAATAPRLAAESCTRPLLSCGHGSGGDGGKGPACPE